jgi:hypothetical protein
LQQLFQPVGGQAQPCKQLSTEAWISPNGHEQLWNIDPFHSPALAHRIRRLQQLLQVFADEQIRPSPRRLISQHILQRSSNSSTTKGKPSTQVRLLDP